MNFPTFFDLNQNKIDIVMGNLLFKGHKKLFLSFSFVGIIGVGIYLKHQNLILTKKLLEAELEISDLNKLEKQNQVIEELNKTNEHPHEYIKNLSSYTKSGKIEEIVSQIIVSYIQNSEFLEPKTIVQILQLSVELASDDYVQATLQNRRERRFYYKSQQIDHYERLIVDYNEQIEIILEKAQAEILYRLNIHKDIFEESLLILLERGYYQQLYMLQASVKQKIKEKIPSLKNLNRKQIIEIIKYNIQILRQTPDLFTKIITNLQSSGEKAQLVPMAINAIISDQIFEKYGIEEEDQIRNLKLTDYMCDVEIQLLLEKIDQLIKGLVGEVAYGPGDESTLQG